MMLNMGAIGQGRAGDASLWLEACLKENPRALLGRNVLAKRKVLLSGFAPALRAQ